MKAEKRLLQLKQNIEDFKEKKAQAKGAMKQLTQKLEEAFNCSTIEELKAKEKEIHKQLDKLETKMEKQMAKLEEEYGDE